MNRYEEELQNNLDAGKTADQDSIDVKAYQTVFSALNNEPHFTLSESFADTVVLLAMGKQKSKGIFSEYFWFGCGLFLLLTTFITAIVLSEYKFDLGFLNALSSYKGLIVFGLLFIIGLHWLDKRLIRPARTS